MLTEKPPPVRSFNVELGPARLPGLLRVPEGADGIVVFAQGSGTSRRNPRNMYVAGRLCRARLAVLLFDLLLEPEEADPRNTGDPVLLADRLEGALEWVVRQVAIGHLPIGLFASGTGAAAALLAAARRTGTDGPRIDAVVCRGGRTDIAADAGRHVRAPTLLIVGGSDADGLSRNAATLERLAGPRALEVVSGSGPLFEEPGALDAVIRLARTWFATHLRAHG